MLKTVLLRGIRCFREEHRVPLAKLTLLVGENSTGKTTFLAAARLTWDVVTSGEFKFNEPPFLLGSYDSIAHYHGGQGKRAAEFALGGSITGTRWLRPGADPQQPTDDLKFEARFVSDRGQPRIDVWEIRQGLRTFQVSATSRRAVFGRPGHSASVEIDPIFGESSFPFLLLRQQLGMAMVAAPGSFARATSL